MRGFGAMLAVLLRSAPVTSLVGQQTLMLGDCFGPTPAKNGFLAAYAASGALSLGGKSDIWAARIAG